MSDIDKIVEAANKMLSSGESMTTVEPEKMMPKLWRTADQAAKKAGVNVEWDTNKNVFVLTKGDYIPPAPAPEPEPEPMIDHLVPESPLEISQEEDDEEEISY